MYLPLSPPSCAVEMGEAGCPKARAPPPAPCVPTHVAAGGLQEILVLKWAFEADATIWPLV